MRSFLMLEAMVGALATAACMTNPAAQTAGAETGRAGAGNERIEIGADSRVCVSVEVDQRIWPHPLTPDSTQIFSGSLMAELRNLHERRGGSTSLPRRGRPARFVTNEDGANPDCQDRGNDVFVVGRYLPRADGSAFVFDYRIGRGPEVRSGQIEVNVAAEIRAGRIPSFTQRRTMVQVIYADLLSRAPIILDYLAIRPN